MKADRTLKVLLAVIALFLAINCATNLPFSGGATTAAPPSFLEVGKSYTMNGVGGPQQFKVLKIDNSGWINVQSGNGTVWLNTNVYSTIWEQ